MKNYIIKYIDDMYELKQKTVQANDIEDALREVWQIQRRRIISVELLPIIEVNN